MWGWTSFVGLSVPTCQPIAVTIIESNGAKSTPPYYMIAYPLEGTPRTYPLGETKDKLQWQMDYEAGTQLLLQVVDSEGVTGGIENDPFVSVAGSSTACVQADSPNAESAQAFSISANITGPSDRLATCDYWGLTVTGGQWPYTWSLVASQSPVVTNVTSVSEKEDTFTYVNRADPERIFLVAASDATGKYAYGRTAVNTTGSADVACRGRAPSLGNSQEIARNAENEPEESSSSSKRGVIIGAAIGGIVFFVLVILALFFFWRRKKRSQQRKDINLMPTGFSGGIGLREYSIEPFSPYTATTPYTDSFGAKPMASYNQSHNRQSSSTPLVGDLNRMSKREEMLAYSRYRDSNPSTSSQEHAWQQHQQAASTSNGHDRRSAAGSRRARDDGEEEEEIVIQHRDAGAVNVREVPPAYADLQGSGSATAGPSSYAVPPPTGARVLRSASAGEDRESWGSQGSQVGLVGRGGEKSRYR